MQIIVRVLLVLALVMAVILAICNVKSHNMYPKLDEYIKGTLAFNFLYMILLCMYLLYRILTM